MRPSRTRGERLQPQTQYLNEKEHKEELHKQADQKRNEKKVQQLQDKEDILKHYQNYNLAKQPELEDQQLNEFIAANKQILDREIQETFEKYPEILEQKKQAFVAENKKEQERLARLQLRDEERKRRANGQESAYQGQKETLPFQLERLLKENVNNTNNTQTQYQDYPKKGLKEDLFTPVNQQQMPQTNYYQPIQQIQQQQFQPDNPQETYSLQQNRQQDKNQNINNNVEQNQHQMQIPPPRRPSIQRSNDDEFQQQMTILNQQDQQKTEKNQAEKDKQRQYKQELDQQINWKKNQQEMNQKPLSSQSTRTQNSQQQQDDFYSKFGQQNKPTSQFLQQQQPTSSQSQRPIYHQDMSQAQSNNLGLTDQQRAQQQKQKYREELDHQIKDKKQQQEGFPQKRNTHIIQQYQDIESNAQDGSRQNTQDGVYQNQQFNNIPNQINHQERQFNYQEQQHVELTRDNSSKNIRLDPYPQQDQNQQAQRTNFARKMTFTNDKDQDQVEKQKFSKQKYAEELKLQVEERNNNKKNVLTKQKDEERLEQQKFQRNLLIEEDLKKENDQKLKQKQVEFFEHKVGDKNAQRKQNIQLQDDRAQQIKTKLKVDLFDESIPQVVDYNQIDQNQQFSSYDRIMQQQQQEQQPQQSQQYQLSPQNYQQPQLTPKSFQQYPQFTSQQINGNPPISSYQYGLQQQLPAFQNPYDQINYYQNILFQPQNMNNAQNINMQIHQNYLLQLQQNKHELEMVRQILEEKQRIQQLEFQNQLIVEQYKHKVKDIQSEQAAFEKEILKLKAYLKNKQQKEPLDPQVFSSALYMSVMMGNLKTPQDINQIYPQQQLTPQKNHIQSNPSNQSINQQINLMNPEYNNIQLQIQNQIHNKIEQAKPHKVDSQNYQHSVQHLLPQQAQPKFQDQQDLTHGYKNEDTELPASSDYVQVLAENNSIWHDVKVQENKSYMPELQYIKTSQLQMFSVIENIEEFQMISSQNTEAMEQIQEFDKSQVQDEQIRGSHLNVDGFDVNMLRTQDYLDMFKQNIQSQSKRNIPKIKMLQMNSKYSENNLNSPKPLFQQLFQEEPSNLQYALGPGSQDTETMTKSPKSQSCLTNAISQFQSKIQNSKQGSGQSSAQENFQYSQLAMSSSIPLSQIQQAQELIMSDAKFNSLYKSNKSFLPDDEIDEEKFNDFIDSVDDPKINLNQQLHQEKIEKLLENNICQKDPFQGYDGVQAQSPPTSNYFTGRSEADSVLSKKYKKPRTIDIFSKLDQNSMSQNQFKVIRQTPLKQQPQHAEIKNDSLQNFQQKQNIAQSIHPSYKSSHLRRSLEQDRILNIEQEKEMVLNREQYVQTPEPYTLIKQYKQLGIFRLKLFKVLKSPHDEQLSYINIPPPSNIYSNCTNLNPLNSQTTFIVNDKRADNTKQNRLENFLLQMEQSQDQPNQKSDQSSLFQSKQLQNTQNGIKVIDRQVFSRKARDLLQARKDDTVINKLDEMGESQESTPHSKINKRDEYSMMFKYEDDDIAGT